ncbi:MAG: hypothetical protein QF681_17165 [Vicinamibacterales bacterium]|jgi:hypothetical protein|nr:hypothetical protein [Vicinamibacterales bacterium]
MAEHELPPDFSAFLRLLNAHEVRYLVVGGYAVAVHGYPRATGDIDIWVPMDTVVADRIVEALLEFGFDVASLSPELFQRPDQIVRLGVPPMRIELLTTISGVDFEACYPRAVDSTLGGVPVRVLGLADLKVN